MTTRNVRWTATAVFIVTSMLLASPAFAARATQPATAAVSSGQGLKQPPVEDPTDETDETDPVEINAIAEAVAAYFEVPAGDIESLHEAGVGFGVITAAYELSKLEGQTLTPQEIIALKTTGEVNWGQLLKELKLAQQWVTLGDIMSAKARGQSEGQVGPAEGVRNGQGGPDEEHHQGKIQKQDDDTEELDQDENDNLEQDETEDLWQNQSQKLEPHENSSGGSAASNLNSRGNGSKGDNGHGAKAGKGK